MDVTNAEIFAFYAGKEKNKWEEIINFPITYRSIQNGVVIEVLDHQPDLLLCVKLNNEEGVSKFYTQDFAKNFNTKNLPLSDTEIDKIKEQIRNKKAEIFESGFRNAVIDEQDEEQNKISKYNSNDEKVSFEKAEPEEIRSIKIRRIISERNIQSVIHFTRLENLESILKNGLLSHNEIKNLNNHDEIKINDPLRLDNRAGANCLSISFPNYKMFFSLRQNGENNKWVVLKLDPRILWQLDCAFCQTNAASNEVRLTNLNELKSWESFEKMFLDSKNIKRSDLHIPACFPTNPQAEVLIFNTIHKKYIKDVVFLNFDTMNTWVNKVGVINKFNFIVDDDYFHPRVDYQYWSRA